MKKSLRERLLPQKNVPAPPKSKSGVAPGTLKYTGDEPPQPISIEGLSFKGKKHLEAKIHDAEKISELNMDGYTSWINVNGVHDPKVIRHIGVEFGLHPLVQEDIMNVEQRPKAEDYGEYLYFVTQMAHYEEDTGELDMEQVSIILGDTFILSFQEHEGDIFDPIRNRIRNATGKVSEMGGDYLAYLLLDAVLDQYFLILEKLGERIDGLEVDLLENPKKETLKEVYAVKQEITVLRKSAWPMREIANSLAKFVSPLVTEDLKLYLRDFHDHAMRIMDSIEAYRDTAMSMVDLYLSSTSHKMNDVMKVLTVISTIFIPLTFITGYYGMNLKGMKEGDWPPLYPVLIAIMVVMVIVQLIWFRRKKWI